MSDTDGPAPKMPRLDLEAAPKDERTIRFDDPDPNLHDVVFSGKGRKFYCVKMTLAKHSPHFYELFSKDSKHIGQKNFTLQETVNPDEFDVLLMILHGVNKLNDGNVSGVLRMSRLWKCGVALQQCIVFLKTSSKLPIKEKFDLAVQFELEDFKKEIVSNIESAAELKTLLPSNLTDLDHSTMALLLEKSMELHERNPRKKIIYSPMYSPTYSLYSP